MTVEELTDKPKQHWPEIKSQLLNGHYRPPAVKRVEIPKAGGRKRKLGIPTVIDRFTQQAIAQVLAPILEPHFRPHSHGFRPALEKLKATAQKLCRRTRGHSINQIITELRTPLLGWTDFCSCKICISTIPGGQSTFWHSRNKAPSARCREMNSMEVTVLSMEAVEEIGLPQAQTTWRQTSTGVEYRQISTWPVVTELKFRPFDCALPNRYFRDLGLPNLVA